MKKLILGVGFLLLTAGNLIGQEYLSNKNESNYQFKVVHQLEALPVENQGGSGTCWSFSALSFFESELMRLGKGEHKLSEMFVVRNAYIDKARNYVRMHGNFNFGAGGAFHDIPYVIRKYGIVPQSEYKGLQYGTDKHKHFEMDAVLKGMADAIVKNPNKTLSNAWEEAIAGAVDAYLGDVPETFNYRGKQYTPKSFAKYLELTMDDYVVLSSFTHHPFYSEFVLEVPDNWAFGNAYNLPLEELMDVMRTTLEKGFTFAWAADVSEKGFSFRDGLAIVPEDMSTIEKIGEDNTFFSDAGSEKISTAFNTPVKELSINQAMRQEAFNNYQTTDDHGMHVTGMVKDQHGTPYFIVKNSWGIEHNDCDGYFYASEAYLKYKTLNIMVHKNALSKTLLKKLSL